MVLVVLLDRLAPLRQYAVDNIQLLACLVN